MTSAARLTALALGLSCGALAAVPALAAADALPGELIEACACGTAAVAAPGD